MKKGFNPFYPLRHDPKIEDVVARILHRQDVIEHILEHYVVDDPEQKYPEQIQDEVDSYWYANGKNRTLYFARAKAVLRALADYLEGVKPDEN